MGDYRSLRPRLQCSDGSANNHILVGIIVAGVAAFRAFKPLQMVWLGWVNVVAGVWLVAAPFVLGYSRESLALWNGVVVGIVIAVLAWWSVAAGASVSNGQ